MRMTHNVLVDWDLRGTLQMSIPSLIEKNGGLHYVIDSNYDRYQ